MMSAEGDCLTNAKRVVDLSEVLVESWFSDEMEIWRKKSKLSRAKERQWTRV